MTGQPSAAEDPVRTARGTTLTRRKIPLIVTLHHPITRDRMLEMEAAPSRYKRWSIGRWYSFVKMQGNAVFRHAVRAMTQAGLDALEAAKLGPDDIDLFIPHQANMRIMEACRTRLGIPVEKMFKIIDRYGNMSAATVPVAIHEAREAGRMPPGSNVAMAAFGTGLTWAGAILRT